MNKSVLKTFFWSFSLLVRQNSKSFLQTKNLLF